MPHITSIERLAREEGIAQGREQGIEEGRREGAAKLIVRQTRKRFRGFASSDEDAIRGLSVNRLEELSEALLDFTGIEELREWLSQASRDFDVTVGKMAYELEDGSLQEYRFGLVEISFMGEITAGK